MKNFLRALKLAWNYRVRLSVSFLCALAAAAFWSLNFTAIYPVLKILGNETNLQQWVDGEIQQTQTEIEGWKKQMDALSARMEQIEKLPPIQRDASEERHLAKDIAKVGNKLTTAQTNVYYYHVARRIIYKYLPTDPFQTLALVICLVMVGVALKGFFEFWQEFLVGSVVGLSLYNLRNRFFRNVLHLDANHFGKNGTHEIMARFTNDMETLGNGMKTLLGRVVAEPLRALGCVIVACFISWKLTLMFLILVPFALFLLMKVSRVIKKASRRLLERMSTIYKLLQESCRGIHVVKAFTGEPYERRRFRLATKAYYRKAMWVVMLDALSGPVIELLGVVGVTGALLVGAYLVLNKKTTIFFGIPILDQPMDTEGLIQLYVLLAAIADPVRKLSKVYTKLQSGAAASDRVFGYFDLRPTVRPNSNGPRLKRHSKSIEFRDVCYSYGQPKNPALSNVNLMIEHGKTIALVGRNGSGKSTLIGLLPRFFDPDHGAVFIDGIDVSEANLRSIRRQISIVTQDTILFEDDSIYNNIRYGNRAATREQVEQAAKQAQIHDFIAGLPEGYETRAGEASGGQKQRIALARAILCNPSILILDEFTSQTDTVSESDIHRVLREFMKGRTTFVITHRLNTLEFADRIVVLENGRVEAVGGHQELLETCPVYQSLHKAPFQRRVA